MECSVCSILLQEFLNSLALIYDICDMQQLQQLQWLCQAPKSDPAGAMRVQGIWRIPIGYNSAFWSLLVRFVAPNNGHLASPDELCSSLVILVTVLQH